MTTSFCNILYFEVLFECNNSRCPTNETSALEDKLWRKSKSMLCFRRCVSFSDSFFCRISERRNAFQRNSGTPSLVRICMHDPNLALVFFPACKSVGSFATSRASAHRAAKKAKSSKERQCERLLVAYRSTRIDLKCLARKFVGKLITFAGCDLIAQVVNGPVRCIEGDRIEQQRPHWPPVGHKHFVCGSQTPVCIE